VSAIAASPGNRLLAALTPRDYKRLAVFLTAVPLEHGAVLHEPGEVIQHAYFPESGLVSFLALMEEGATVESGMVGKDGFVGHPVLLEGQFSPFRAVVQIPGAARRMEVAALRAELNRGGRLARLLARYLGAFLTQLGQTAACNGRHTVVKRCCRWLLGVHDRIGADEFPLTHEFLAAMLGVRRTGVTEVAGALQRAGLIRYRRGRVTILDRPGLEAAACCCYPVIRQAHDDILA
jgi:CRP-like cAMP-binding protein